jgi:macrolide-specific efflux system membrane fusion protein
MKKLGVLLVMLALAGAAWFFLKDRIGAEEKAAPKTVTVEKGDVERTVTSLGKLKPKDYVDVGTQVSGQLKKVHVEIGDRVEKGALIAEIDPTVYETRVRNDRAMIENLRATVGQQEAELQLARKQLDRNKRLLEAKAISAQTVEENEANVAVAKAKLVSTRAQIKAAEASLEGNLANVGYTKIFAPMSGTVVSESALEGQTVNASQQAPVIVRVANLDTMTVWAQVAEADVPKVKTGMPAWFTTLGMPDRKWRGTVRQVLPTPEIVNDVVLYNVLVDVDNHEGQLMTDMTVQVFFVLGEAKDVPTVPMAALKPAKDGAFEAQVLTATGPAARVVKLGVTSRTVAEVKDGLAVGDQVIVAEPPAGGPGGRPGGGGRQGGGGARRMMGPRL